MPTTIQLTGVEQAIANLAQLPRRVALRHLRIALNAAGGEVKRAITNVPRETGLLKRSLRVKVKIPAAAFDPKYHSKPAYVLIGAARHIEGVVSRKGGRLRVLGKKSKPTNIVYFRKPSRYAHLAEKHKPYLAPASRTAGPAASARAAEKLAKAFETEAAALPK